jgi:hypothetical protein
MVFNLNKILQNFRVEYIGKEPGIKIGLIRTPSEPLEIRLIKRN